MEIKSIAPTACQYSSWNFQRRLLFDLSNAVMDANGEILQYLHIMARPEYRVVLVKAYAKELGRLAQGLPGVVDGTDTIDFITKYKLSFNRFRDVTYGEIVCNYWEEKEDPYRARIVIGSDRINYPGDVVTPKSDMLSVLEDLGHPQPWIPIQTDNKT